MGNAVICGFFMILFSQGIKALTKFLWRFLYLSAPRHLRIVHHLAHVCNIFRNERHLHMNTINLNFLIYDRHNNARNYLY